MARPRRRFALPPRVRCLAVGARTRPLPAYLYSVIHLVMGWSCLVTIALTSCSVPTDDQYFPPVTLQTFVLTQVTLPLPGEQPQPINPIITLTLSDLPDPATVQFPTLQLGPRGRALEFFVEVSLVDRQLTLRPKIALLPETDYFVRLGQDLRALSGQRLEKDVAVPFHTGNFVLPAAPAPMPVTFGQLLGGTDGLRARCGTAGCHSGNAAAAELDFAAPEATLRAQLLSRVARGSLEDLVLVRPGVPEQSYLVRKLVAGIGFARISGAMMPPAGPPLDPKLLRDLELWIRQGAH